MTKKNRERSLEEKTEIKHMRTEIQTATERKRQSGGSRVRELMKTVLVTNVKLIKACRERRGTGQWKQY